MADIFRISFSLFALILSEAGPMDHFLLMSMPCHAVDSTATRVKIDELSSFSDSPLPSVTRILYSHNDVLARRFIKNLMGLPGLSIREDDVDNIFGRWEGSEPDLPAVSTGSHIDAIPYSGKYDGVVGVLGAIEAINVLKRLLSDIYHQELIVLTVA